MPPVSRFELTADEYRWLVRGLPGLTLPTDWTLGAGETARPGETPRPEALAALAAKGVLLEVTDDPDLRPHTSPAVLAGLALHSVGQVRAVVQAWQPQVETRVLVDLVGPTAAGLAFRRATGGDFADATVEVTLAPLEALTDELLSHLPAGGREAAPITHRSLGLAESRAVIAALERGEGPVTTQVVEQVHASDSVDLLRQLTGTLPTGFRVTFASRASDGAWTGAWLLGETDWIKIGLAVPAAAAGVPERLAEQTTVHLTSVGRGMVRADLLGVLATWVKEARDG